MLIAVAIFDHCSVIFYELNFERGKLSITERNLKMTNIHKMPVK